MSITAVVLAISNRFAGLLKNLSKKLSLRLPNNLSKVGRRQTFRVIERRFDLRRHIACLPQEAGQATAEYGVVILIAMALGLAVLALFTGGALNSVLETLVKHALSTANGMIH